jgi:hypothetical protein
LCPFFNLPGRPETTLADADAAGTLPSNAAIAKGVSSLGSTHASVLTDDSLSFKANLE